VLSGINVAHWRGPGCWINIFQFAPYIPTVNEYFRVGKKNNKYFRPRGNQKEEYTTELPKVIYNSIDTQTRYGITGVAVAFSYRLKPSRINSATKCRLGPTKAYCIYISDTKYIPKDNMFKIIDNSFHFLSLTFSWTPEGKYNRGQFQEMADPVADMALFAVMFINSTEPEGNIKSYEYLCGYCEPVGFSGCRNEQYADTLSWLDEMAHQHRHHKWEIRPKSIQATLFDIQLRKFYNLKLSFNINMLLSRKFSQYPSHNFDVYVLETLQEFQNFSITPGSMFRVKRNHFPRISVGTNPSGFQQTAHSSYSDEEPGYASSHLYRAQSFIVTSTDALNFLTCFHIENISFHIYIVSFQQNLWITLGIVLTSFSVTLHFYLRFGAKTKKVNFSPYFLMFSTLVEHSYSIPDLLSRRHPFRIAVGIWLLLVTTLTTGYKGASISKLTSPLPKESITHFDNLTTEKEKPIDGNLSFISSTSIK